jgi:cobaltochelatase CobN
LDAERELVLSEQTPGDVVFLSAADTDLAAASLWVGCFGKRLRLSHAASLRQPAAADYFVRTVAAGSRLVVARLLGGRAYFPHLLQAFADLREQPERPRLLFLPATGSEDAELEELSDFPRQVQQALGELLHAGGTANLSTAGKLLQALLEWDGTSPIPQPPIEPASGFGWSKEPDETAVSGRVWITYYRAWQQTGDTEVVESLSTALEAAGLSVAAFYCQSLRETEVQAALIQRAAVAAPDIVITLQSFAVGVPGGAGGDFPGVFGCPVLQVVVSANPRGFWESSSSGLTPAETAIHVALPELDGRILGTVAGFKEEHLWLEEAQCFLKRLKPDKVQVDFIARLAELWTRLRRTAPNEKRVAIILANYPNRDGRIGNGVGLDTPASCIAILNTLAREGYDTGPIPCDAQELMRLLTAGITNDEEASYGKDSTQWMAGPAVAEAIAGWPQNRQQEMQRHWPGRLPDSIPVPGLRLRNIFIGIQPPRGFSLQSQAIYHSPDLPPPPQYVAFYQWIREQFKAHAVVHLGKHGNLEWLPGRSTALGPDDYPRLCLGPVPHLYPFIVNNPGEGTQAKRRTSAVIIDHLTPPLTRAGLYGQLEQMERLLEEHGHCVALYPRRAAELEAEMERLLECAAWKKDLPSGGDSMPELANFLCELKESQIRSGLHVFGKPPGREHAVDFILSILRLPSGGRPSLYDALCGTSVALECMGPRERDDLHGRARAWVENCLSGGEEADTTPDLALLRKFVVSNLAPLLARTEDEMRSLLSGLGGRFIPPGPAGAPTRGRIDVLPTGRNFYALDPRTVPTQTAWRCGKSLAEALLKRHFQDHGEPLLTLALVVWGTSNMRTGGDDLAQALWLWGCEPVWEESSGRVVDFKILPAALLGRPRVDITLRISGLFRDAFGDTVRLLAAIPKRLAELEEPPELNPIRAHAERERLRLSKLGVSEPQAMRKSVLRVFTSGPGCYGTGLLPLIDAGNWETRADLAEVFLTWGHHAAGADGQLTPEPEVLRNQLSQIQAVAQNQDNREHDILDSDDYFQFQGGLQSAIEHLRGAPPSNYHGDSSDPSAPRIRSLEEEMVRVLHSRALNPRWIQAMQSHGYKGAFEMAATVDYVFGYSATTGLVRDHHFEALSQSLLIEQEAFFKANNPDALREAASRMLEAVQRGLWSAPSIATLESLENILLSLEGERE